MRDEFDINKFDVESMQKEMREMRITTDILNISNQNLLRDKENITK